MSTTPKPPTPVYILRGHAAPIHALHVFHDNLRLISADANGWVVVWDLVLKRPVVAWKAHDGAVLEAKASSSGFGKTTEVYTHGRDHKLRVWRFRAQDEEILQKVLPVDRVVDGDDDGKSTGTGVQPWMVHSLPVNALNFCAFSLLFLAEDSDASSAAMTEGQTQEEATPLSSSALIAAPNALDSGALDIFQLPVERRVCTIPADPAVKTGMVMAAKLLVRGPGEQLYVAAGYEDGRVAVFARRGELSAKVVREAGGGGPWEWEKIYACRLHSQPVLAIDVFAADGYFVSSSADALLVKHPVPPLASVGGHQGVVEDTPLKNVNTKHAGQQGVRIRSDGKIFATAGWDSRVRVYSCRSMKELAVLKWHKEGCYVVAFADVRSAIDASSGQSVAEQAKNDETAAETQLTQGGSSLATLQRQRNEKVQNTHWLAAGSKDGKISLWDIY
ncbi:WD repeat protein [Aspergillus campestris IBT 28561]|uniref:ASTRA-associated protein 1 n=1 Tax=Aspergillus campestris (strain IBT 28561) TaxID=1392248 RepID=A0A2I1D1H7_ASPC2|nr:WD repeat protein [Aspergillus campestris IBT 28561]PKY03717.1 WD repeat protein [Aspergillus campestris IBT 28561]